jgi:DNA-directed RNA polymerase specialized sigma24 family protein
MVKTDAGLFNQGCILSIQPIDQLLQSPSNGDRQAAADLLPLVYGELKILAAIRLRHEASGQTLQATALVHEAYLRFVGTEDVRQWDSKRHFFAAAVEVVKLRVFSGLTIEEVGLALGVSPRTADSDWTYARAWLID